MTNKIMVYTLTLVTFLLKKLLRDSDKSIHHMHTLVCYMICLVKSSFLGCAMFVTFIGNSRLLMYMYITTNVHTSMFYTLKLSRTWKKKRNYLATNKEHFTYSRTLPPPPPPPRIEHDSTEFQCTEIFRLIRYNNLFFPLIDYHKKVLSYTKHYRINMF